MVSPFKTIELCILKGAAPLGFVWRRKPKPKTARAVVDLCRLGPVPSASCVIGLPRHVAGSMPKGPFGQSRCSQKAPGGSRPPGLRGASLCSPLLHFQNWAVGKVGGKNLL